MKTIKVKIYGPTRAKYDYLTLTSRMKNFLLSKQEDKESLTDYTKRFKQLRDNFQVMVGTDLLEYFVESTEEYKTVTGKEKVSLKAEAFTKWTAGLYLNSSSNKKYGQLKNNLQEQYALGNNQYPKTINTSTDILINHKWDPEHKEYLNKKKQNKSERGKKEEEVQLQQDTKKDTSKIDCFCCGKKGHYSSNCPEKDKIPKSEWAIKNGLIMSQTKSKQNNREQCCQPVISEEQTEHWSGVRFNQVHSYLSSELDKQEDTDGLNYMDLVLLDTGATFSLVKNRALITGVTKAKDGICMRTNVGTRNLEEHGRFMGFDRPLWYNKNSIANIFSFAELAQQYRITYDSSKGDHFNIHGTSIGTMKFKKSKQGLYYNNFLKNKKESIIKEEVQLVHTVA